MAIDAPLVVEIKEDYRPGTRLIQLSGPVTLRNLFTFQEQVRALNLVGSIILDLSGVPYMDSAGMGLIINYYVHCEKNKTRLVAAGVSPRVMELFKMTKVDSVIPLAPSVEAAT